MRTNPQDLISRGQQLAESLMTLNLTAYSPPSPDAERALDADGYEIRTYKTEGTCCGKVQAGSQRGGDTPTKTVTVGGVERPVIEAGLHIPLCEFLNADGGLQIRSGEYGLGWEFAVTGVTGRADRSLIGRRYLVVGVPSKSFATARRLDVVEVSS